MIVVHGARGTLANVEVFLKKLLLFSKEEGLVVQVMDATMVYSKDHLLSAASHALRAFEQKTNATGSLALELLLYAAGERQIDKAIKKMGVKKGTQQIAVVLINTSGERSNSKIVERVYKRFIEMFHLTADDAVLQGDLQTLKRFGITEGELSTISENRYGDLILEKVAFVDVMKK